MSADQLDLDDADQIRDAADRAERLARTARRVATTDPEAVGILTDLAGKAEDMAQAAAAAAEWIERHRS